MKGITQGSQRPSDSEGLESLLPNSSLPLDPSPGWNIYPWVSVLLLGGSCLVMQAAWYLHLRFPHWSYVQAVFFSWGLAFFEYLLQVPGNKLGRQAGISSAQLKAIAEFFVLVAFIVFNKVVLGEKIVWNHLVGFGLVLAGVGVVLVGPFEAKVFVKSSDNSVLAETFSNASDCK